MNSQNLSRLLSLEPQQQVIRKHANAGTMSQNQISVRLKLHNAWQFICPSLEITGRQRNSNTSDGLKREPMSEHTSYGTHGRITNLDYSSVAKLGCHAGVMKTPKRFSELSVKEIPHRLPK